MTTITATMNVNVDFGKYQFDNSPVGYSWRFNGDDPELLAKLYKMADDLYRQVTERKSELCQK